MTTARPAPVHIDDYATRASPRTSGLIQDAVAPMAAELRLEAEPMLEQAGAETGLERASATPASASDSTSCSPASATRPGSHRSAS